MRKLRFVPLLSISAAVIGMVVAGGASARDSDPVVVDGAVYFSATDGTLRGAATRDFTRLPGFPVDVNRVAHDGSTGAAGRPEVYYGNEGKGIYVLTVNQTLVRVAPDGTIVWSYRHPDAVSNPTLPYPVSFDHEAGAPVVTPDGFVFLRVVTDKGAVIVRLRQSDGGQALVSPPLAVLDTPAIQGGNVYCATETGMAVLDAQTLTVKASFDAALPGFSPYVSGPAVFVGVGVTAEWVSEPRIYRLNSATLALDDTFGKAAGHPGYIQFDNATNAPVSMLAPKTTNDPPDTLYVDLLGGMLINRIYAVDMTTGDRTLLPGTNNAAGAHGLTYNRARNALVYAEAEMPQPPFHPAFTFRIRQISLADPAHDSHGILVEAQPSAPAYDVSTGDYIAVVNGGLRRFAAP